MSLVCHVSLWFYVSLLLFVSVRLTFLMCLTSLISPMSYCFSSVSCLLWPHLYCVSCVSHLSVCHICLTCFIPSMSLMSLICLSVSHCFSCRMCQVCHCFLFIFYLFVFESLLCRLSQIKSKHIWLHDHTLLVSNLKMRNFSLQTGLHLFFKPQSRTGLLFWREVWLTV